MPLFIQPLARYFDFQGRARRAEYWQFWLFTFVIGFIIGFMDKASGGSVFKLIRALFTLAIFIPSLAVAVRRLHDTNRTGWWVLFPAAVFLLSMVLVFSTSAGPLRENLNALNTSGSTAEQDLAVMSAIAGPLMLLFLPGCAAAFLTFIFHVLPGTPGPNRFGDDPKGGGVDIARVFDAPEQEITLRDADTTPHTPVFDFSPTGKTQQRGEVDIPARGIPVIRETAPPPRPAASGFGAPAARPTFGKRGR